MYSHGQENEHLLDYIETQLNYKESHYGQKNQKADRIESERIEAT